MTDDALHLYQRAAQKLVIFDAATWAEHGMGDPGALNIAHELYDRHGPFELSWYSIRDGTPPEWYDPQQDSDFDADAEAPTE